MRYELHFKVDPPRQTHQSAMTVYRLGNGQTRIGRNAKGDRLKRGLVNLFSTQAPEKPITKHVEITLTIVWPFLASDSKKKRAEGLLTHAGSSDSDNLAKLYLDSLAKAGWIKNDNLVTDLIVRKRRGPEELVGIYITIEHSRSLVASMTHRFMRRLLDSLGLTQLELETTKEIQNV